MPDRCKQAGTAAPSAFAPFAIPARNQDAGPAADAQAPGSRARRLMRTRCPDCDSTWIGFPAPPAAVVVLADGSLTEITLAHSGSCRFLDFDDIDRLHASCLDCGLGFDATPARSPMQQLGDEVVR